VSSASIAASVSSSVTGFAFTIRDRVGLTLGSAT
jgi:hypothetical protein